MTWHGVGGPWLMDWRPPLKRKYARGTTPTTLSIEPGEYVIAVEMPFDNVPLATHDFVSGPPAPIVVLQPGLDFTVQMSGDDDFIRRLEASRR